MSNLINGGSPYVHSTIYNFHAGMESGLLDIRTEEGQAYLDKAKARLIAVAEKLEKLEKELLGGLSPEEFSRKVLHDRTSFPGLLMEILREKETREAFFEVPELKSGDIDKLLMDKKVDKQIQQIIKKNKDAGLLRSEFAAIVKKSLTKVRGKKGASPGESFFDIGSLSDQAAYLESTLGPQMSETFLNMIRGPLKSESGRINEVIDEFFFKMSEKANSPKMEKGFRHLRKRVEEERKKRNFVEASDVPIEELLKNFEAYLKDALGKDYLNSRQKVAGFFGEHAIAATGVFQNTGIIVDVTVTGNMTEEQLREKLWLDQGEVLETMPEFKTHHQLDKFTQTDLILTNQNGKTFGVQSKNYMEALFKTKASMATGGGGIPAIMQIQGETKVMNFFSQFNETGWNPFTESDIENLAYFMANTLWFNLVGTFARGKNMTNFETRYRRRQYGNTAGLEQKEQGLQYAVAQIDRILTNALANYLGVVVAETVEGQIDIVESFSNSFYLVSNTALVPISAILRNIAEALGEVTGNLFKVEATLKNSSAAGWAYKDVFGFHLAKAEATGGLDSSRGYTDLPLLQVGYQQGESIMNTATIERINLRGSLYGLLGSAYVG